MFFPRDNWQTAGLLDIFDYVGEEAALEIVEGMASYFKTRIDAVLNEKGWEYWQKILDTEFGGMNEVGVCTLLTLCNRPSEIKLWKGWGGREMMTGSVQLVLVHEQQRLS